MDQIAALSTSEEKIQEYERQLEVAFRSKNSTNILSLWDHLLREETTLVVSRPVLLSVAKKYGKHFPLDLATGLSMIDKLKPRLVSFEDVDALLRQACAELAIEDEEYIEAARLLGSIQAESSKVNYSSVEKVELYVKCAELYLQEDDTVTAETMLNRATREVHILTEDQWSLKLRHLVCYARILDAKRKFLDAAGRYYELSQSNPTQVDAEDLLELLSKAVTCALLSQAGPARSRILSTLIKDERVKVNRELCHAGILEKMVKEQLLSKTEVASFEEGLLEHQKAILSNGFTVLENAVVEHNIAAISRVYQNINLQELGTVLEIDRKKAETVLARMITEKRLTGTIDHQRDLVEFDDNTAVLQNWDTDINAFCCQVNTTVEAIKAYTQSLEAV